MRMFPMLEGPAVPWDFLAPYEHRALRNHDQSLERLAQRGGLDQLEALALVEDRKWGFWNTLTSEQKTA